MAENQTNKTSTDDVVKGMSQFLKGNRKLAEFYTEYNQAFTPKGALRVEAGDFMDFGTVLGKRYFLYLGTSIIGKCYMEYPVNKNDPIGLKEIMVKPTGKGHGSFFMAEVLKDVDGDGRSCWVSAGSHYEAGGKKKTKQEADAYALRNARFYERFGFKIIGHDEQYNDYLMVRQGTMKQEK